MVVFLRFTTTLEPLICVRDNELSIGCGRSISRSRAVLVASRDGIEACFHLGCSRTILETMSLARIETVPGFDELPCNVQDALRQLATDFVHPTVSCTLGSRSVPSLGVFSSRRYAASSAFTYLKNSPVRTILASATSRALDALAMCVAGPEPESKPASPVEPPRQDNLPYLAPIPVVSPLQLGSGLGFTPVSTIWNPQPAIPSTLSSPASQSNVFEAAADVVGAPSEKFTSSPSSSPTNSPWLMRTPRTIRRPASFTVGAANLFVPSASASAAEISEANSVRIASAGSSPSAPASPRITAAAAHIAASLSHVVPRSPLASSHVGDGYKTVHDDDEHDEFDSLFFHLNPSAPVNVSEFEVAECSWYPQASTDASPTSWDDMSPSPAPMNAKSPASPTSPLASPGPVTPNPPVYDLSAFKDEGTKVVPPVWLTELLAALDLPAEVAAEDFLAFGQTSGPRTSSLRADVVLDKNAERSFGAPPNSTTYREAQSQHVIVRRHSALEWVSRRGLRRRSGA